MSSALPMMADSEMTSAVPRYPDEGFGALTTERGVLPLKAMTVETRVTGLVGETRLRQTFVNALADPLEATYVFPLPDRAAVRSFRMEVAGRVVEGDLKERGEARREYQVAIQSGHRAALAEEERPDVFTLQVGNLMPGESAVIDLTLTGPLVYDDGEVTFRFPLVVAPRYIPGNPLGGEQAGGGTEADTDAVPDASRISPPVLLPGFPNPVRLALSVEVDGGGFEVSGLRSSLHAVVDEERGKAFRKVRIEPGERLNRDFILRWRLAGEAVRTGLALVPDENGKGGTYQLTLLPPAESAAALRPRDVVFVLDRSGSMGGWKMVAARRALARMVDTLTERDRFAVYAFDNAIETPPHLPGFDLAAASDRNRFRAVEFLARVEARGGTEMAGPLNRAADQLGGGYQDRDRILVLLTDGQVGNEDQILRSLAPRLKGTRIFTLGIDQAVNAGFLRRLAITGGGACELVESEDRLDEVMARVHRRLAAPVLRELSVEAHGMELVPDARVPERLPDLFPGAPLTLHGRYVGRAKRPNMRVRGADAAGLAWSADVEGTSSAASAITAVWARAYIRQLEDRYATGQGNRAKLERLIVETSLGFCVLSRFTAFVAVDRSEKVNPGGKNRRIMQPVEAPEGWDMLAASGGAAKTMAIDPSAFGGMAAPMAVGPPPAVAEAMSMRPVDFGAEPQRARLQGPPLPAPASPPAPGVGGLVGAIKGALSKKAAKLEAPAAQRPAPRGAAEELRRESEAAPGADLSAYRERARRLLDALEAEAAGDGERRRRALGKLGVGLRELLEDLDSIGAGGTETKALEELSGELKGTLRDADLAALWTRAVDVLRAFTRSTASAPAKPAGTGREFWK